MNQTLTPKESRIAALVLQGMSAGKIAKVLQINARNARRYVATVKGKIK